MSISTISSISAAQRQNASAEAHAIKHASGKLLVEELSLPPMPSNSEIGAPYAEQTLDRHRRDRHPLKRALQDELENLDLGLVEYEVDPYNTEQAVVRVRGELSLVPDISLGPVKVSRGGTYRVELWMPFDYELGKNNKERFGRIKQDLTDFWFMAKKQFDVDVLNPVRGKNEKFEVSPARVAESLQKLIDERDLPVGTRVSFTFDVEESAGLEYEGVGYEKGRQRRVTYEAASTERGMEFTVDREKAKLDKKGLYVVARGERESRREVVTVPLRDAQGRVTTLDELDSMLDMVHKGRFDELPRIPGMTAHYIRSAHQGTEVRAEEGPGDLKGMVDVGVMAEFRANISETDMLVTTVKVGQNPDEVHVFYRDYDLDGWGTELKVNGGLFGDNLLKNLVKNLQVQFSSENQDQRAHINQLYAPLNMTDAADREAYAKLAKDPEGALTSVGIIRATNRHVEWRVKRNRLRVIRFKAADFESGGWNTGHRERVEIDGVTYQIEKLSEVVFSQPEGPRSKGDFAADVYALRLNGEPIDLIVRMQLDLEDGRINDDEFQLASNLAISLDMNIDEHFKGHRHKFFRWLWSGNGKGDVMANAVLSGNDAVRAITADPDSIYRLAARNAAEVLGREVPGFLGADPVLIEKLREDRGARRAVSNWVREGAKAKDRPSIEGFEKYDERALREMVALATITSKNGPGTPKNGYAGTQAKIPFHRRNEYIHAAKQYEANYALLTGRDLATDWQFLLEPADAMRALWQDPILVTLRQRQAAGEHISQDELQSLMLHIREILESYKMDSMSKDLSSVKAIVFWDTLLKAAGPGNYVASLDVDTRDGNSKRGVTLHAVSGSRHELKEMLGGHAVRQLRKAAGHEISQAGRVAREGERVADLPSVSDRP